MATKLGQTEEIQPIERGVDDRLALLKGLGAVNSRLRQRISDDWVLAKLEEKDKEACREMLANAYYVDNMINKLTHSKKWYYETKNKTWTKRRIPKNTREKIEIAGVQTFDAMTIRVETTVVLSRNVKNNWLVRLMCNTSEEEPEAEGEDKGDSKKILEMLKQRGEQK